MHAVTEPRWERRKDARPTELAAAALDLFVEKGFAATRLEDVAARAGVSKGTLYLYFDSKEALFKEVVRASIVPALADAEQRLSAFEGSSAELLQSLVQRWWSVVDGSPIGGIPKLMFAEARNFPALAQFYHDEVIVRGKALFGRVIARGIERGEFRSIDVKRATESLIGAMLFQVLWKHSFAAHSSESFTPKTTLSVVLDIFIEGLRK